MPNDNANESTRGRRLSAVYSIRMYPALEAAIAAYQQQIEADCRIRFHRGEIMRSLLEEQLIALSLLDSATPERKKPAVDAMIAMNRGGEDTTKPVYPAADDTNSKQKSHGED